MIGFLPILNLASCCGGEGEHRHGPCQEEPVEGGSLWERLGCTEPGAALHPLRTMPPPAPVRSACAFHTRTGMPHTRSFCHMRLNGCCGRSRTQTVNFTKLDLATLKSLKRHYRLKTREKATKSELAQAVAKHFAAENIDEV